ncbi:ATP synthase subunit a [human gut metagenome]|uniref:ATP synthase subunit a n=2 Tax=root TaxID=1 RepID=A0A6L9ENK7_CLOBU|nr:F0F1 ATP synthase subunit A [Clostridium butyricum]MDU4801673.1 F0F1 ATP synthase subunit A [Clostridium butyricum]NAS18277.1 F0F1 ATP synthase subunit A [Clostridium butyricum]
MEQSPIIYSHNFGFFTLDITTSVIVQWVIIAILGIGSFLLTRNLKEKPDKKQAALEKIYITIESVVTSTMGESYLKFIPYIGSLMIYLIFLNFMGLIGIKPPTQDLSVTVGLAITTFITIHYTAIKRNGFGGYLKGYIHPFAFMAPINVMERVMLPVSLALRLFGNMLAATILVDLVYEALGNFAIGIPIIVHGYFDLFDGTIQMLVFSMLTMIQIKLTAEH